MGSDLTHEQQLQENALEFKTQMTLFVHDIPDTPIVLDMDKDLYSKAKEIETRISIFKNWLIDSIDKF
jgi:hypothetical protein